MIDPILPPKDGRHVASPTPNRCERWLESEQQYVTLHCTRHANLPPGTVEPPRQTPACGNLKPHAPHNGFATPNPEPWCKGVPDDGANEMPATVTELLKVNGKLQAEVTKLADKLDRSTTALEECINSRDTFRQDLAHMKRWCAEQLKRLHREIEVECDKIEPSVTGVVALANQRKGIRMVLAELSRLENA